MNLLKSTLLVCVLSVTSFIKAQDEWKLPMVNSKIQFEFNSDTIERGKLDLCAIYSGPNYSVDVMKKLRAAMSNGKVKFFSASNFMIVPQLYNADFTRSQAGIHKAISPCNPNGFDTLVGSLTISLKSVRIMQKERSGTLKCMYRIVLKDKSYNIKFRGFEYSYTEPGSFGQPPQKKVVNLEDEYTEIKPSKGEREYWSDLKMIVTLFNSTLENTLKDQVSALSFD